MDLHYSQTIIDYERSNNSFTTLWIYTILKHRRGSKALFKRFTTLWIYTILKRVSGAQCVDLGFTTLWIYTILKQMYLFFSTLLVSLPYGFTLFSNRVGERLEVDKFHYLMDLHYSQTRQLEFPKNECFTTLWIYTILKHRWAPNHKITSFTTLWIYTILKQYSDFSASAASFTTLWIYTILKPQISCAHYTAQGKSTRSSTIVLWRNGIVKGAQIPIQHIEFGAHIYARRCLAL